MSVAPGTLGHPQDLMKGMTMEDTWVSRDLPVLAAVRLLDGGAWEVTVAVAVRARSRTPAVEPTYMSSVMR